MTLNMVVKGAFWVSGLVCLLVIVVVFQINNLEKTAEVFITSLQSKETKLAYNLLSSDLQNELPYDRFKSHMDNFSFENVEEVNWADRYRENEVGFVSGQLINEQTQSTHFDFILGQDEDDWKIYVLNLSGLDVNNQTTEIEKQKELESRVPFDLHIFLSAVRSNNLTFFYNSFAQAFQRQYTEVEFANLYGPFGDYADEISGLLETQISIAEYKLEQDGLVRIVKGYYFNQSHKFSFTIKYFQEDKVFKIIGLNTSLDALK